MTWEEKLLAFGVGGIALFATWKAISGEQRDYTPILPKEDDRCRTVVLLGDSTISGATLRKTLESSLGPCNVVVGKGFPGQESKIILTHMGEVVNEEPTHVVVLMGVNDIYNGKSLASIKDNLATCYALIQSAGAKAIGVPVLPWFGYTKDATKQQKTEDLNSWILYEAGVDSSVDVRSMGDESYRLLPEFDSGDHLHPNARGQEHLAGLITGAL